MTGSRFEFGAGRVSYSMEVAPMVSMWCLAVVLRGSGLIPGRWWVFLLFPVFYVCAVFFMVFLLHMLCKVRIETQQQPTERNDNDQ